jgi:hypothetical protein
MSAQWSYTTMRVSFGDTGRGTRGSPDNDWNASLRDGSRLAGWDAILDWFSEGGWEIFSVVGLEEAQSYGTGTAGVTKSFRIFAKKPR